MAFRELSMVDVREVLRRWQLGQSARQIARDGIADRKTAQNYIKQAVAHGFDAKTELIDECVALVLRAVQNREAPAPSDAWTALNSAREQIEKWLKNDDPL